jgi:nitrogen fixation/metabolism regulation signal transduction histidine kinase
MANATLHHLLGIPTNRRLLKKRIDDVIDLPDLIAFLRQAIELPPHRRELTLSLDRHGHKRMLRIVADPVPLARNEPPHWLVCLADCTTEMEMQRAMTWAQMAQRVAHDVKNPLTSILLTLQRLQMEYRERAPEMAVAFDTYTTRIIERIESLRRMAQNFMKFVNVEKLSLIEGDLNALVKEASGAIGKGLPPDIDLELKLCPELPRVRFDPEPMQSVLENLVSNAINAMPEGGKITISTQLAQGLQFFPATGEPRDYVEIEVQDTGVGIEASDRERLFEPNFTASPNGTGLGLAMVKKIIDDHGGHIEVNSEPGAGSAFCVYLPVGA